MSCDLRFKLSLVMNVMFSVCRYYSVSLAGVYSASTLPFIIYNDFFFVKIDKSLSYQKLKLLANILFIEL